MISSCVIIEGDSSGVAVFSGAHAAVSNCRIGDNRRSALQATDPGTQLRANNCLLFDSEETGGAYVAEGASAWLSDCLLLNNESWGLWVRLGGAATLTRCELRGTVDGNGLSISDDSRVLALDCSFENNSITGLFCEDGGHATAQNCHFGKNEVGVWVYADTVRVEGSVFEENRRSFAIRYPGRIESENNQVPFTKDPQRLTRAN